MLAYEQACRYLESFYKAQRLMMDRAIENEFKEKGMDTDPPDK